MNPLDLFFPKRCVGCSKIGRYICASCKKRILPIATNECICPMCEKPAIGGATHPKCVGLYTLDGLTSFFYYSDVVRSAIKEIKYRYVSDAAGEFINLVPLSAYEIRSITGDPHALLVPIPLHSSRLRYRGFNQAALLGELIANKLRIPVVTDMLSRTKETRPQVDMKDRTNRLGNMHDVFAVNHDFDKTHVNVKEMNILLFDDVFTTGATMRAAANILKRRGVRFVWGVTMAR